MRKRERAASAPHALQGIPFAGAESNARRHGVLPYANTKAGMGGRSVNPRVTLEIRGSRSAPS